MLRILRYFCADCRCGNEMLGSGRIFRNGLQLDEYTVKPGMDVETAAREILSLRLDAVHKPSPASLLSIIGALIAVYVYWAPELQTGLLVWFGAITAVAVTNLITGYMRMRGIPRNWSNKSWVRFVMAMHLLSGLTWGIGGAWMLTVANEQQALVTLAIGLTVVSVSIPSIIHQGAYNLFHLPIYLIYAVGLLFSSLEYGAVISFGFVLIGVFSSLVGRPLGKQLNEALVLSIENKHLVERLAEHSAALEVANRKLEIESLTDPLTGVANRRQLMSFARTLRGRCAVLILDIDHFKSYNDSFGHTEGDVCLVAVAETLSRHIKLDQDMVARLGGEEFAVVLADVSEAEALQTADAIRLAVESLRATRPHNIKRLVTISIGVAVREIGQRKNLDTLMEQADAAVYRAKTGGRNMVCLEGKPAKQDIARPKGFNPLAARG
jgi:diguanylate cyclase (GGDEF)-like protein